MSSRSAKGPVKIVAPHPDDDLDQHIRKANSRKRLFAGIVLAILLVAFVATSALQVAPLLFHKPQATAAAGKSQMQADIRQLRALVRLHPQDEGMR